MIAALILTITFGLTTGWFLGYRTRKHFISDQKNVFPKDYLVGLNYLLNEEADKAVDVFIEMLEVDSTTVETHLAVGKLFRRRGEVDRAIRIHQNLIERPKIDKNYHSHALFELAQDYLSAGFLDRAEGILLSLQQEKNFSALALQELLNIYQQEKEWEKAIQAASKLEIVSNQKMKSVIAHYYCELSEIAKQKGESEQAKMFLKQSLEVDHSCVRASLLFAKLEMENNDFKSALKYLKNIKKQNSDYLSEAIDAIVICYEKLKESDKLISYFMQILEEFPRIPVVMILSNLIRQWKGDKIAANFVANYVRRHPSLSGINLFINLYLPSAQGRAREDLLILQNLMHKLLADKPLYKCINCGFAGKVIHWQCPGCKKWDSIKPTYCLESLAEY